EILFVAALITVSNRRFRIDATVRRPYMEVASRHNPHRAARSALCREPVTHLIRERDFAQAREPAILEHPRVGGVVVHGDGAGLRVQRRFRVPETLARQTALARMAKRVVELKIALLVIELRRDRELAIHELEARV